MTTAHAQNLERAAYYAEHHNVDELERLFVLDPELHPNSRQMRRSCGTTLLHTAVAHGAIDCVAFLMQNKSADPYAHRIHGTYLNIEAAKAELTAAVAFNPPPSEITFNFDDDNDAYHNNNDNDDEEDDYYVAPPDADTPMQSAMRYNDAAHRERFLMLLTLMHFVPQSQSLPYSISDLLIAAIRSNLPHTVRALLKTHGANVDHRDRDGLTPLAHALECRHNRIARMLVAEFGANLHYDTVLYAKALEARFPPTPYNAEFRASLGKRVYAEFNLLQLESAVAIRRRFFTSKKRRWARLVFRTCPI